MITVTLKDHIGRQEVAGLGYIDVVHDQWIVSATNSENGQTMFVGYCAKRKGGPFLPCVPYVELPASVQEEIRLGVNQACGEERPVGILPLSPRAIEEYERQLEGDDEDGDDE